MAVATYQYWMPITDVEHYLYAKEIAQKLNLITKTGSFAEKFVEVFCNNMIDDRIWVKTYYKTKGNNFKQVFHPNFVGYVKDLFITGNDTVEVIDNQTGKKYTAIKEKVE